MIATAAAILRKDLTIEVRRRESVPAMVLFTVTVSAAMRYGFGPSLSMTFFFVGVKEYTITRI